MASGLGKGVTAASIGRPKAGRPRLDQKLDPYLDLDRTMSTYQHGEVFVTDATARDRSGPGHYERFVDENRAGPTTSPPARRLTIDAPSKERRGDYLGGTIQVIPHVTNEIKRRIAEAGRQSDADVLIVEVGGTVGDIEGLPFLEAIRQMRKDAGATDLLHPRDAAAIFRAATS